MNDRRNFVLDSNIDIFKDEERIVRRQKEDHLASIEISKKLRPIIEKIYSDAGKESPFKKYTSTI